mgnify:FL=1
MINRCHTRIQEPLRDEMGIRKEAAEDKNFNDLCLFQQSSCQDKLKSGTATTLKHPAGGELEKIFM